MLNNDAWSAVAELAASQHGCFTITQAANAGIGRRRLRRALDEGMVERAAARVMRFAGVPHTWHGRLMAACLSSGGVASHRSAAYLHEFDGHRPAAIEVSVARGRMPSLDGVAIHRWADPDVALDHTEVLGIPVTSVAATLAQLGAVVRSDELERALDGALRDGASLAWINTTLQRLERPGPSGTAVLRRLLDDGRRTDVLPDSWFERLTQRLLDSSEIPRPAMQHTLVGASGRTFRLDFAWPDLKIGLECHSRRYHFGPTREADDHRRDLELAAVGWELIYMTWSDRQDPARFLPLLATTLATRRRQLLGRSA